MIGRCCIHPLPCPRFQILAGSQVEHIGEAIKDHPKLRHISFRDNEITTKGANKFSRAAQTNKVLMHVDFDENSIGPAFPMDIFLMSGVKKVETLDPKPQTRSRAPQTTNLESPTLNSKPTGRDVQEHDREHTREDHVLLF